MNTAGKLRKLQEAITKSPVVGTEKGSLELAAKNISGFEKELKKAAKTNNIKIQSVSAKVHGDRLVILIKEVKQGGLLNTIGSAEFSVEYISVSPVGNAVVGTIAVDWRLMFRGDVLSTGSTSIWTFTYLVDKNKWIISGE